MKALCFKQLWYFSVVCGIDFGVNLMKIAKIKKNSIIMLSIIIYGPTSCCHFYAKKAINNKK